MRNTALGDRRPHPGGHWLHALTSLEGARVWWATTSAIEEAEDALLTAFAATIPAAERAALHDSTVVMPFANLRTATGERKKTGLANSLVPADPVRPTPAGRIVDVAPGSAEGAGGLRPTRAAGGTIRRSPRAAGSATPRPRATPATPRSTAAKRAPGDRPATETTWVSAEGMDRLKAEHAELVGTQRPAVIGRIKAAKELGDLKENADYSSAREEQSFLEGRIAAIEATLRVATVIETPDAAVDRVTLGSTVTVEDETGAQMTFVVVGSAEADPNAGRISNVSPVGRALLGRSAGDDVAVAAPRGEVHYKIVELT
jgi:transcription elongation factor GreA